MKPSPKKSLTAKVKQRTKSSSSGSAPNQQGSNSIGNSSSGGASAQASHHHHHGHHLRGVVAATATGGSDTNSSGNDANSSSSAAKDKSSYKSYAGFSSRSVRTIWEQHDKQETEVVPDVYNKLAEDTTYKLWELANNIKTYSRHASGKVTYDLVNEVLKDCDVPPIVGANNEPWDKIEYDGVYFFNSDEVLDLREEYTKDVTMEQSNVPVLTTSWMAETAIAEDLIELYNNVCDAVYIGDEECFEEAIDILTNNPHVPSLMKLLLTKAIEMLGFEYTDSTLERSLKFLEALVKNYHVSHSDLTLELSLLCQIFVNLLLGPANLVHAKFIPEQLHLDVQPQSHASQSQQPHSIAPNGTESSLGSGPPSQNNLQDHLQAAGGFNHSAMVPMNILENNLTGPSEDSNNSNSNATEELLRSIENIKEGPDGIDINNIKDEYEALFSMVQGLGKQEVIDAAAPDIKTEFNSGAGEFDHPQNFVVQQQQPPQQQNESELNFEIKQEATTAADIKLKQEPLKDDESASLQMSESTNDEVLNPNSTTLESENITTLICAEPLVDEVSRVIGLCASKWGFVEQECTFLLVERLQRYFDTSKGGVVVATMDYGWLARILRGLWSVGEFAFRELCPYFGQINPDQVPEFVNPHLSVGGMFLQGKSDIFFYEYLSEICGDQLVPFTFQYEHYIERQYQKYNRLLEKTNQGKNRYKISPKIVLKPHPKQTHLKPPPTVTDLFPERSEKQLSSIQNQPTPVARFSFRFAGCRPVPLKTGAIRNRHTGGANTNSRPYYGSASTQQELSVEQTKLKQNDALVRSFHSKVVIARRKLLAPDTNHVQRQRTFCYGSTLL